MCVSLCEGSVALISIGLKKMCCLFSSKDRSVCLNLKVHFKAVLDSRNVMHKRFITSLNIKLTIMYLAAIFNQSH